MVMIKYPFTQIKMAQTKLWTRNWIWKNSLYWSNVLKTWSSRLLMFSKNSYLKISECWSTIFLKNPFCGLLSFNWSSLLLNCLIWKIRGSGRAIKNVSRTEYKHWTTEQTYTKIYKLLLHVGFENIWKSKPRYLSVKFPVWYNPNIASINGTPRIKTPEVAMNFAYLTKNFKYLAVVASSTI